MREAGTVHVGGDEEEVLAATAAAHREWPERPFLLFGLQSIADPTRAPAGSHTAWAYTHGPAGDRTADGERVADRVEAQVERFAPGFRDRILARHEVGVPALDQLVFRPLPSLAPYRTPVGGLYLGSAATFPGGAAHGVPGHAAARLALAEARLRRW